jgi:hypothetical protein
MGPGIRRRRSSLDQRSLSGLTGDHARSTVLAFASCWPGEVKIFSVLLHQVSSMDADLSVNGHLLLPVLAHYMFSEENTLWL